MKEVDNNLVSIIMPAYNAEATIKKTISSVIEQTYVNWELIIVDDGSTDRTKEEICSVRDNRIVYIFQENGGPAKARNRGIDKSSGEYLCFLDADDLMHKNYLKQLVTYALRLNSDVTMCDYIKIRSVDFGNLINDKIDYTCNVDILSSDECILDMLYKKRVMPYPYLKLFRKESVDNIRFPEHLRLGEDLAFNYEVFKKIDRAVFLNSILYFHVDNPSSITHTLNEEIAKNHFDDLKYKLCIEDKKYNSAIISRMFVEAYDFLCQMIGDGCFATELINFIKENTMIVLSDRNSPRKVRLLAMSSLLSISLTVNLCKFFKRRNMSRAI